MDSAPDKLSTSKTNNRELPLWVAPGFLWFLFAFSRLPLGFMPGQLSAPSGSPAPSAAVPGGIRPGSPADALPG